MNCCQCQGIEEVFSQEHAVKELKRYRSEGPARTTRMLVDAIKILGVAGLSLLDIGGGVGAVQHSLLEAGVKKVTDVDASSAYLSAAIEEAKRRGYTDATSFRHGNFVELAENIAPADIVTLDRVICCYNDMENLVGLSAARAGKIYGVVFPRDTWYIKIGLALTNFFLRLQGNPFRGFSHPTREVEAIIQNQGLKRRFYNQTLLWQVVVYTR